MDGQTQAYVRFFSNVQHGGELPVFRVGPYFLAQQGAGFGDVLKNIFKTVFPVALHGLSSFLGETLRARDQGSIWKDAAKSAIPATAHTVVNQAASQINSLQKVSGKRRKGRARRRRGKVTGIGRKAKKTPTQHSRPRRKRKRVYKDVVKRARRTISSQQTPHFNF